MDISIKKIAKKITFKKNIIIFKAQDRAEGFYYIESGLVRLYKMNILGKEAEIARLQDKEYFGEAIIFASDKYQVFAQTLKPTVVYYFPKKGILEEIKHNFDLARFLLELMAGKCVRLNKIIEILALSSIKERLVKYILMQHQKNKSETIILPSKKADIASQIGTISATLSRNLKVLQKERLIEVKGRTIKILDLIRLQKEMS